MTLQIRLRPRLFVAIAVALFALSASVNVLQAQRIQSLLAANNPAYSSVGKTAVSVEGFSLTGERRVVSLPPAPTVVYFFSPTCSWCERNWMNIQALNKAAIGRFRLIAVTSARGLQQYVQSRELGFEVIEGLSQDAREAFGFTGTPHTIVVSAEGLITHDWRGAYTPRIERQIEQLFDVSLPGVSPKTPAPPR